MRKGEEAEPGPGVIARYVAEFEAPRDGNVAIFANDAVLPFAAGSLYANNCGRTKVSIVPADVAEAAATGE
jgi:hypothetical protein